MIGRQFGEFGTIVPASGAACQTVVYGWLQVYDPHLTRRWWISGSGSTSASSGGSVANSRSAAACAFFWRATNIFSFTVAIYVVSLVIVSVRCMMSARSLYMAVSKFAIKSTMSW